MNLTFSSNRAPGDADRTLQFRPRPRNANATQEVALDDILEVLERGALGDAPGVEITQQIARAPRRRLGWIVALAVAASLLILAAAAIVAVMKRTGADASSASANAIHAATKLAVAAAPPSPSPAPLPAPLAALEPKSAAAQAVRVEDLPRVPASTGTLRLAGASAGHRVFVDGVPLPISTVAAEVTCGAHAIKIGSQGRAQRLDVPCGGELALSSRAR